MFLLTKSKILLFDKKITLFSNTTSACQMVKTSTFSGHNFDPQNSPTDSCCGFHSRVVAAS